mmetsp:Transcript_75963/g.139048  ORF Transcript_75963/g.139048 Transcript_75963/m.139048 type:complete len:506 (-) Transcript_75963:119-1636(-)
MLISMIRATFCVLLGGAVVKGKQGSTFNLRRLSWQEADKPSFTAWTPPPDYAWNTLGHKTMYLADVSVGDQGQTFRLLVDTGSPFVIVPGASCAKCSHHFQTNNAKPSNRTASVKFGLGSLSGHIFEDHICVKAAQGLAALSGVGFLQSANSKKSLNAHGFGSGDACAKMFFIVADQESADIVEEPFDGILGLGLESSSDISASGSGFSFLSQLANSGAEPGTTFALRLSSSGKSQLFLGGIDESSFAGGRAIWVPLSPVADGSWQFSVEDFTLDGQEQSFGGFQAVIDSGTSLLAADDDISQWFREHLTPKDCNGVDHLPKLGLRIGGGSVLSLLPADYIDQRDGKCNLALMPSELHSVAGHLILGDSFMRRYTTIFDRENMRLGFGIAADESMAKEILPAMFPTQTTTLHVATTSDASPPSQLDYGRLEYIPVTTPPPPTAAELEATQRNAELNAAFSGLGDDLEDSFEQERRALVTKSSAVGGRTPDLEVMSTNKHSMGLLK